MKKLLIRFSPRQLIYAAATAVFLLIFAVLSVIAVRLKGSLADQRAAERWAEEGGFAQVSCFFDQTIVLDHNQIMTFRNHIETGLREASYETANDLIRPYIDAYSSQGKITLESDKTTLEVAAVGVGGDFFLCHPARLLKGAYFSENDLMQDRIVIDENAAWQLFGSSDVVGMQVKIHDIPHIVVGVIQKEESRMWKAAGWEEGLVYVSAETLATYGQTSGIHHYEAVIPNPVSGFAYRLVKETFGYDENEMMVVDNTDRYSLKPLLTVIADFGLRPMQNYAIQYPYWENYARGYEDILALLLLLRLFFLAVAVIMTAIALIIAYRRRTWTWKGSAQNGLKLAISMKERIKSKTKNNAASSGLLRKKSSK